jgi:hypothetical protein
MTHTACLPAFIGCASPQFFKNLSMVGALLFFLAMKHDLRQAAIGAKLKSH